MYSISKIKKYKDSWLLLESLKGSPMPMACLRGLSIASYNSNQKYY